MNDPQSDTAVSTDISNKKAQKLRKLHLALLRNFQSILNRSAKVVITDAEKYEFVRIITALKELSPDALYVEYEEKSQPRDDLRITGSSTTPLMYACMIFLSTGNLFFIEELLKAGADINAVCETPPLKMAARALNPTAVKTLLDNCGAHVDGKDNLGFTAFQYLIIQINCNTVKFEDALATLKVLLTYSPSLRIRMKNPLAKEDVYITTTALHTAVQSAHRGLFDLLVPYTKDVNEQNGDGLTVFHHLLNTVKRFGATGVHELPIPVLHLQEYKDRSGKIRQQSSLMRQPYNVPVHVQNFVYMTVALLQRNASISVETQAGISVSSLIAEVATPEMLEAIIEFYRNNINENNAHDIINLMIDLFRQQKVDNAKKIFAVIDEKIVKAKLTVLTQEDKNLLLSYGLQVGELSAVQRLVEFGADIHCMMEMVHPATGNLLRVSLPTVAMLTSRRDVLEYFLSQDANILVGDKQVLFGAIQNLVYEDVTLHGSQLDTIAYLLKNKVEPDLDSSDCNGVSKSFPSTPLALACLLGHARVVTRLLLSAADPNCRTANQTLPIICAIQGRHRANQTNNPQSLSFKYLLKKDWYINANHLQVIRLLLTSKKYQRSEKIKDNPLCCSIYYAIDKEFFFGLLDLYKSSPADLIAAARYAVGIDRLEYFRWIHEFILKCPPENFKVKAVTDEQSQQGEKEPDVNLEKSENPSELPENQQLAKQILLEGLLVAYSMKNKRLVRQFLKEYNLDPNTSCPDSPQTIHQWLNNISPIPQPPQNVSQPAASLAVATSSAISSGVSDGLISSRQYLLSLGFTVEDIDEMRRCTLEATSPAVVSGLFVPNQPRPRNILSSWFDEQLVHRGSDTPTLKHIDHTTQCFLWIPTHRLIADGCPESMLEDFCKIIPSIGTKNLKRVKRVNHEQFIRVGDNEYLLHLTYQLKMASSQESLAVYTFSSFEEGHPRLYIALHCIKANLREDHAAKLLESRNAVIDLTSEKDIKVLEKKQSIGRSAS